MLTCPSCGQENPDGFRFCGACGASLAEQATAPREERKIVTVLFADLVGFTARAERLDPEDVRALLAPYHERLRSELERFGGTVEKFIGDAVMAVFGAPLAHEDDPERAVRAALAIRDAIAADGELELRIGITTGEALIALDARPEAGEGMAAGDVVNTAARLQATAPTGGVLVDETTYRATERAIDYGPAESVVAKGKTGRVPVWEALRARGRVGVERLAGAPLVAREQELTLLRETLARVKREREPQLVTLVGVPGIGKSRLVFELFRDIEANPELVYWRRGRSLPYGEGVTFWALAEIVKAHAGILESDRPEQANEKLGQAVETALGDSADRSWVEPHLRALAGLEADERGATDRRGETFAAWRRFFESLAEQRPLVLVFEDLHWADDALLDFLDHVVDWASGVPILVLGTARPELLVRRAGWGGGKVNSSTILLSPLSEDETALLVHSLLGRSVLPAEVQTQLLERSGGNPLYAEEFARLVGEQGSRADAVQLLPETVQGIIAARLDALPSDDKALLQNAAVIGKDFWLGAVCAIGEVDRSEAEERMHALERMEFVRRERRPSVEGETEYVFRHVLVRDVAYSQIPRARRATKHRLAAEWIESLGRPDNHAEMLAHHYTTALELRRAGGKEDPALARRARGSLRAAGDRAMTLAAYAPAERFYSSALGLCGPDDPERPQLLLGHGRASYRAGGSGLELLAEALAAFRARGDAEGAAEAASLAAEVLWFRGDRDAAYAYMDEALELVSERPPSREKAGALLRRSGFHLVTGEFRKSLQRAREALPLLEQLGLVSVRARALNLIGWSRVGTGDAEGLRELEEAAEIASETKEHLHSSFENLRSALFALGQLEAASATLSRHTDEVDRLGESERRWVGVVRAGDSFVRGHWDDALRDSDEFLDAVEAGSPHYLEPPCRALRTAIWLGRGDLRRAANDAERALEIAERSKDGQVRAAALGVGAIVALLEDRRQAAGTLASDLSRGSLGATLVFALTFGWPTLAEIAWLMHDLERLPDLRRMLDAVPVTTPWVDAARAIAEGEYVRAADTLGEMGYLPGEAEARMRAGQAFLQAGLREEAEAQLALALDFYRSVGATRHVADCEALADGAKTSSGARLPGRRSRRA